MRVTGAIFEFFMENIDFLGKVYERGTFSVKNGIQKDKGFDLKAEPPSKFFRCPPCSSTPSPPPGLFPSTDQFVIQGVVTKPSSRVKMADEDCIKVGL